MKTITIVIGCLLAAGGIYCMVTPGATFLRVGWLVGVLLLASGINSIAACFFGRSENKKGGAIIWDLLGGVFTTLLAAVILANGYARFATDIALIYIFAGWMTLVGTLRILAALKLKSAALPWGWIAAFGVLSVLLGVYSFFHPVFMAFTIGVLIGLQMLTQGLNMVAFALSMPGKKA
ncbi:MAG: DUF308 domain-containing protein [Synergistaceae bacterium]|nr:DUF308 domain-containing protein [Synergistaceae bacterium]